jgi:RND superfamily putative drug exporter
VSAQAREHLPTVTDTAAACPRFRRLRTGDEAPVSRLYAGAVVFLRFLVPPAWIAAAIVVWHYGPTLAQLPDAQVDALIPSGLPSERAEQRIDDVFGSSLLPRLVVVVRDPGGLGARQQAAVVRQAARLVRGELPGDYPPHSLAVPYVNTLARLPAARERGTTAVTYLAFPSNLEIAHQRNLAAHYADQLTQATGVRARLTGFVAGNLEQSQAISDHLVWVTLATLAVVAAIIGLYMRSLLAPLVTLAAAGLSWILATRTVAWVGLETGLALQQEVEPIVAVLLLGVVTDYSVFFLAGSRSRLLGGEGRLDAARSTTRQFIPIVFTAGWLVAIGLTTLRVGSIGFVQSLGPSLGIVVLVSMLVCVTLVPALIAIFGRRLFWPGLREPRSSIGVRIRTLVARALTRRWVALPVSVLLAAGLLYAAGDLTRTRLGVEPVVALQPGSSARQGASEAGKGFAQGIVAPTEVAFRGQLDERRLESVPGVAAVVGPAETPRIRELRGLFRKGEWRRYLVVFEHDPYGARGVADLDRLRAALPSGALVAGDTAIAGDTVERILHDMAWVALAAFAVEFVLLALFLRALVAPLLLLAGSAAALAATFGLTTLLFQGALGYEQLTYYIPLAAGVLLLAFGSDYNLFVVGRIWQEAERAPVGEAIRRATPRAGRAISVAGVALALSFASLAIVPLRPFREFAFATAAGVLIDTFVVRSYLVPALLALFGRLAWWPSRPKDADATRA